MAITGAFVYLAQNTQSDASYGVARRQPLELSLELLYLHHNATFRRPVLIFHEGDFSAREQAEIIGDRPEIQFREIQFQVPEFLPASSAPEWWQNPMSNNPNRTRFSLGYRHMIRFYSKLIYEVLGSEFEYYCRLDDDSYLRSPVAYDLFEFMATRQLLYGYRVDCWDGVDVTLGFADTVNGYIAAERLSPAHWFRYFKKQKTGVLQWTRRGYYNNFHITKLSFWQKPEVQDFLSYLDRTGGGYKYRWNDLIVQSAAVQLFCPLHRMYKFEDWAYEHATRKDGRLLWGGLYNPRGAGVHCGNTW